MGKFVSNIRGFGLSWRSSKWFILVTIGLALFAETFLYGFLVPMLPYMLGSRLSVPHEKLQKLMSNVLAVHGIVSVIAGPVIGHFADKISSRKIPLQLSLLACIVGTGMVAAATSIPVLFAGRVMQGLAGASVWIVGCATVADNTDRSHMGKIQGIMMSFISAGLIGGPLVSGLVLEYFGYWTAWALPVALLGLDLLARFIMVENGPQIGKRDKEHMPRSEMCDDVTAPLLGSTEDTKSGPVAQNFWRVILTDERALAALFIGIATKTIATSFHATLPLFIEEEFGWGSRESGGLFACLILPTLVFSPIAGWLRDRHGVKTPAAVSSFFQVIVFGLLGLVGTKAFSWTSPTSGGDILYTGCVLAIGVAQPFMNVGSVELSIVVKLYQEESPGIFGSDGGMSRVVSLIEVAASLGTVLGPVIGGFIKETFGYNSMCWSWSVLNGVLAIVSICFLSRKRDRQQT
ncbi:hypothetical protein PDE_08154 [Penicillium oxalicum 114-2]|uniref:Major facilitator superfamily (MFS) profile domain-containing protein n=1 Tax=Penicillium oxalicum (strain 114-2 / CGMCC 5302) TaxID=933388 RepID=S8BDT0_PENO1|nr:hypothetical protein PDE_08154 [Penicillium oxalicum 114-2]